MRFNPISTSTLLSSLLLASFAGAQIVVPVATTPKPAGPGIEGWPGYGRDPSHSATWNTPTQNLQRIRWSTPVDLNPQYSGPNLLIHYGSPLITPNGMVLVTVKTGASGGFRIEGHRSFDGSLAWMLPTDYQLAPHNWTPSCGSTLTPRGSLVVPASGGTVLIKSNPESAAGAVRRVAFYGITNYNANPSPYDSNVIIDTPITSDADGNVYFGFIVTGGTPVPLQSGIARIAPDDSAIWVSAATASNDAGIQKVVYNCAPALSRDGGSIYVAVNDIATSGFGTGYLLKLDSHTLQMQARVRLRDVGSATRDALLPDDGTATPCVGPDGDVFFGVLENPFGSNNLRGWMLHFDGALSQTKLPGAFGWDDTASIVPASACPSYTGTSSYLVLTKYNNYGGIGSGTGLNKVAVLDPNVSMTDPISGRTVMNEVITVLGPTPDQNFPGGVREWCINTAAIDAARHSAIVNNEDGKVYRWDFATNTLSQVVTLTTGIGEAYTPTIIGNDGTVYAINDARLYAVGL